MRDKDRSSDTGTLDRSRSQLRSRLLSQTISARSTRWSDGRLEDIAISTPRISGPLITEMFQKAVQQVTGSSPVAAVTSPRTSHVAEVNLNESRERSPDRPVVEPTDEACTKEDEKGYKGFVGLVLEVWLWLQFVLIIMVFVCAVARRGPRNVLKETDRKRV